MVLTAQCNRTVLFYIFGAKNTKNTFFALKSLTNFISYVKIHKNKGFDEKGVIHIHFREMAVGASQ